MADKSFIDLSKENWTVWGGDKPTLEQINTGCLQRIAAATEAMAKNYLQMQSSLDLYRSSNANLREEVATLRNSNRGLKGALTKAKKKANPSI